MSITSLAFILFCGMLVFLYYIIPKRWQWILLLSFSIYFYTRAGVQYFFYLLISVIVTFVTAIALEEMNRRIKASLAVTTDRDEKTAIRDAGTKEKKKVCAVALVFAFGIWVVLKYSGFAVMTMNSVLSRAGNRIQFDLPDFVLPLGISFYTFHVAGYLIDVYRGKYPAERNFFRYLLFASFFPHMIQGPFSRFDRLGKSLFAEHAFSYDRMCLGMRRMLWGYSKKLLVADKIGIAVTEIFGNSANYPGVYVFVAAFGYGIQIYADFSGYMDIMCGLCQILGIELAENFRQPYFAKSVETFWQRWHITLGAWFKDYVFSPIAMGKLAQKIGHHSRKKFGPRMGKYIPSYFALIFVWTLTGLWHGANWTYIIWGWLNLAVIVFSMQMQPLYQKAKNFLHIKDSNILWQFFQICRTFVLVCFFRFFSHSPSVSAAVGMLKGIFYNNYDKLIHYRSSLFPGMTHQDIMLVLVGCMVMIGVDIYKEKNWNFKCPMIIRTVAYAALLLLLVIFAGGSNDLIGGFMYARF